MRIFLLIAAALLGVSTFPGFAFWESEREELTNFDVRKGGAPTLQQQAAFSALQECVSQVQVSYAEVTATPVSLYSTAGFLTGEEGRGMAVSDQTAKTFPAGTPFRTPKMFLHEHRALFGFGPEILNAARLKRNFVTPHNGMRTLVWQEYYKHLEIFEAVMIVHLSSKNELVSLSCQFIADPEKAAAKGMAGSTNVASPLHISATEALIVAAQNVGETIGEEEIVRLSSTGGEAEQRFTAPGLLGTASATMIWYPTAPDSMRIAWKVLLTTRSRSEMFQVLVDAESQQAVVRHALTSYISDASYRVFTSDSPSPLSPGHAVPLTNQPPLTSRTLVVTKALSTNASPAGWINDGGNETTGNNVDAHLDRNADDSPDLPRPTGSPARVFDFAQDFTQEPVTYGNAATTQLFYWNNWMHDRLYDLGFTEAAGNFQLNNFGRGGAGNDPVQADAQDGSGVDNANFSTPPDGSSPRMQMFVFTGPTPDRDASLDAEVVLHEYAHGLSNRRVGGGVGLSAVQSRGLGEGWSDFYSLALLSEISDDIGGNYATGAYVTYRLAGLLENYYYGIRRYPYSTNLSKNPLTFKDIDPAQAGTHPGIPISPIIGGAANEVHNQGEVWCVILWEVRANLIAKHGYTLGNELVLKLVTDGLNLAPPNPNFVQARDAILLADEVDNDGANATEIWKAFAKRGLGFGATSPSSSTTSGVVESFDIPDALVVLPSSAAISEGPVGGPFVPAAHTYTLTNGAASSLTFQLGVATPWLSISITNGSLPGSATANVVATINGLAAALGQGTHTNFIRFTNATSGAVIQRACLLRVGESDYFTQQYASGFDLDNRSFTFVPNGSTNYYLVCQTTVTGFPTDPAGGTNLGLWDDSFQAISLTGGAKVSLYNKTTNVLYVGSNGYITLNSGDSQYVESVSAHFSLPRISAFFDDLNPYAGGVVSWKQLSNRVAVTYQNVPQFGLADVNSFQIELFFDGTIRLTYLRVDAGDAVVGLSQGLGTPPTFFASFFSSYPLCNTIPPLITSLNATPSNATLVWITVPGQNYRVRYVDDLNFLTWSNLGSDSFAISNRLIRVDPTGGRPHRFYDVLLLP